MTTKFGVRPAPRKRPWICKRSPPCLIQPPRPPSLIATFELDWRGPIFPPARAAGSLLLEYDAITGTHHGTWTKGGDWYDCDFIWNPGTALAYARANWAVDANLDTGTYPEKSIPNYPTILYEVATLIFFDPTWTVRLTITG